YCWRRSVPGEQSRLDQTRVVQRVHRKVVNLVAAVGARQREWGVELHEFRCSRADGENPEECLRPSELAGDRILGGAQVEPGCAGYKSSTACREPGPQGCDRSGRWHQPGVIAVVRSRLIGSLIIPGRIYAGVVGSAVVKTLENRSAGRLACYTLNVRQAAP